MTDLGRRRVRKCLGSALLAATCLATAQDLPPLPPLPSALHLEDAGRSLVEGDRSLRRSRGLQPDAVARPASTTNLRARAERLLLPGEALLVYLQTETALQGWLLAPGRPLLSFTQPVTPVELARAVSDLRSAIEHEYDPGARAPSRRDSGSPRAPPAAPPAGSGPALQGLARLLLPPDLLAWAGNGIEHLTIVPAADTALVPWPALRLPGSDQALVDRFSVSIAPGLTEFLKLGDAVPDRSRASDAQPALRGGVVIGDPAYPADADWQFPPLAGALREAEQVGRMVQARVLSGAAATKSALLHELRTRPEVDLLYLATHGTSDPMRPLDGGFLILAGEAGRDASQSRWTAREIQQLSIPARLVVLSACQTGLGGVHQAGVIGVGRAFYLAGVPQVVVSLWNVDDDATEALMVEFMRQLRAPAPPRFFPAGAMRAAMLAARARYPDPLLWASFVHFGLPGVASARGK